jgi:hypothetical protein
LTFVSGIATDVFVVGAITYLLKASPSTAYDVDVGGSDTIQAASGVSAINKDGTGSATTYYETGTIRNPAASAASAVGVITLTARQPGTMGNALGIASVDSTITASGALLTGGTGVLEDGLRSLLDEVQLNSEAISMISRLTSRSSD